ncbi:MAG: BrnA antitoxin family protein [Candidatus Devosia phytovorans]|uniref:BrnA antitoxin family protein n=1 Tax=Candidatus Devosia phytovorans TaxID=3121372 RepID=A0AAJ5VSM3_9HYPH|nr:BrnA antitoxin family protein [Devosia sp.]WEK04078.1 MAG: BrnA antitoxin family protein [Devosia sp.]
MSDTEENIVRYIRKPLTEEQIAELKALSERPDSEIDLSDIPELTDEFFENAVQGVSYRRMHKQQTTLRLDMDILHWFKSHAKDGKGYQTDINKALRAYVTAQEKLAAKKAG